MRLVCYISLVLLLPGCTAKRQKGDVTVAELFARPGDFVGKRIAVIGYYVSDLEETSLYTSPDGHCDHAPAGGIFSCSIWVSPGWRRVSRLSNRYVRVVGLFHYRPEIRREILKRDDGREFESVTALGFGHMGLSPAELTNVSSFRPLR